MERKFHLKAFLATIFGIVLFACSFPVSHAQYVQVLDQNGNVSTYADNYNNLTVDTENASNLTSKSAVLKGLINKNTLYNTYNLSTWFEYGTSTNLENSTPHANSNSGYANFIATISNLSPSTVYYFRAVAQSPRGVVYGLINSFRTNFDENKNPLTLNTAKTTSTSTTSTTNTNTYTPSPSSKITTNPATSISNKEAEMNALIVNSGNSALTWFEWGVDQKMVNQTKVILIGAYPSVRHVDAITGLTPGTTYYFRAVLENSASNRINGATISFTTTGTSGSNITGENTTGTRTQSGGSGLAANTIGSDPFLPVTMLGWFALIVLVLIMIFLCKHLYHNLYADDYEIIEHGEAHAQKHV